MIRSLSVLLLAAVPTIALAQPGPITPEPLAPEPLRPPGTGPDGSVPLPRDATQPGGTEAVSEAGAAPAAAPDDASTAEPPQKPALFDYPPAGTPAPEDPAAEARAVPAQGLLFAPTARMLEAGAISAAGAIDTVGGAQLELKVGLGGVAEFGIGSTDHIRARDCATCDARTVRLVPMARFVMGLPEHRLFRHQPALAIGFQKSFTRKHDARSSRYAMLYLVASKKLGSAHLHGGALIWDGEISRADDSTVTLHAEPLSKRIRPTAGFEVLARDRSHVIVDLTWNPELQLARELANPDTLRLRPMLSWGVRYAAARRVALEAGVRVPDIGDANLLDAQIFAQLRVASRPIIAALEGRRGS